MWDKGGDDEEEVHSSSPSSQHVMSKHITWTLRPDSWVEDPVDMWTCGLLFVKSVQLCVLMSACVGVCLDIWFMCLSHFICMLRVCGHAGSWQGTRRAH